MTDLPAFDPGARPVPEEVQERLQALADKWRGRVGQERDLSQEFLLDLCDALGTARPNSGALAPEDYKFERTVVVPGSKDTGRIDLYKKGHFVLEAKCGRNHPGEPGGMPVRGKREHVAYIERA